MSNYISNGYLDGAFLSATNQGVFGSPYPQYGYAPSAVIYTGPFSVQNQHYDDHTPRPFNPATFQPYVPPQYHGLTFNPSNGNVGFSWSY